MILEYCIPLRFCPTVDYPTAFLPKVATAESAAGVFIVRWALSGVKRSRFRLSFIAGVLFPDELHQQCNYTRDGLWTKFSASH